MIDFPVNPTIGFAFQSGNTIYKCVGVNPAVWSATVSTAGIPDAPADANTYGRFQANWAILTKATVGLDQVDNTSDANKPISAETTAALAGKEPTITASDATKYWRGDKTWQVLNKAAVGLGNVDNTSDANKPPSANQTATFVLKAGDKMTGNLEIFSAAGNPTVNLNKANVANASDLYGTLNGSGRWLLRLGGGTAADPFQIFRYNDSGAIAGTPLYIARDTGTVTLEGALGVGGGINGAGLAVGNGGITGAAGMRLIWDGGNANYFTMGAGNTTNWSWQWNRSNGVLSWLSGTSGVLFSIDGNGWTTAVGRITSTLNDGADAFYATGNSGFRTDKNAGTAFYAPYGGCQVGGQLHGNNLYTDAAANVDSVTARTVIYNNPLNGMQFSPGNYANGGGGYQCEIAYGSPNYGSFHLRFFHQSGQWVGAHFVSSDGKEMRWSGQTGVVQADGFTPWSDARLKTDITEIPDCRAKIAALKGYEYEKRHSFNYDKTPKRQAGLIAQEVLDVLPVSVTLEAAEEGIALDADDETPGFRYAMDYNGIIAMLVNDNNGLAARIAALEQLIIGSS